MMEVYFSSSSQNSLSISQLLNHLPGEKTENLFFHGNSKNTKLNVTKSLSQRFGDLKLTCKWKTMQREQYNISYANYTWLWREL